MKRWQAISESAAKQSKRMVVPEIHSVMKFSEALKYVQDMDIKLIPYENAKGMEATREVMSRIKGGQSIAFFIGPEGGFDETEVEAAQAAGVLPVSLGKTVESFSKIQAFFLPYRSLLAQVPVLPFPL